MCDEVRRTDVRLISDVEGVVTLGAVPPVGSGSVQNEEPADTRQLSKVAEIFLDMGSNMSQSELPCHVGQARVSRGGLLLRRLLAVDPSGLSTWRRTTCEVACCVLGTTDLSTVGCIPPCDKSSQPQPKQNPAYSGPERIGGFRLEYYTEIITRSLGKSALD
ncbi:hypothetical protein TESG_05572 [Trichophyton tonsurans CBS 112818]|uniref:Uncharacterized protein n=1 Tax=Trichophyton tonsurans (strain CBS 112818) TaxID=647933 RepID=F2S3N7_TRIT1|nr:hypothetical protein TESG_05572 [Trichophyton tonsurans CBS 112818]